MQQQGLTAAASVRPDPVIKLRKEKSVPGVDAVPASRPADPTRTRVVGGPLQVRWPAAGAAEVTVPRPGGDTPSVPWSLVFTGGRFTERAHAGGLPVWVAPTPAAARERIVTGTVAVERLPSKVKVDLVGRRGDALLLTVRRIDGVTQPGRVVLGVDYSGFRDAYGGDWAARLRVVTEPACAAITPAASGCAHTVLPTRNNGSGQLSAEIPVTARPTTFAVTAGASSGAGTFQKPDLSDGAGGWSIGSSSGDFEWSLPFTVPPGIGGPEPTLNLQYSSGAVDGLSSATNNQTSIAGQGFDLGGGGSIERRFKSCVKDKGGNNGTRETGDLCFAGDSMSIAVDGKSGSLVLARKDATGELWRMRGDDGSIVEKLSGAANGDNGIAVADKGEYWRMTSADGTRYYFGLNRLPGWTTGAQETKSAWTVPVFGNHTGEQCNTAASFATSWCQQAYRWNLDYVVDRHGNTMSLYYDVETDNYARNVTATTVSPYVRAGSLKRIEYGQRDGQVFVQQPVAKVLFTPAERCTPAPCGPGQSTTYPDTPWDLSCASTTNCNNHFTPTFWTQKRLAKITTQVWRANTSRHEDVQSWTLRHDYLRGDNTGPALWLEAISAAGHVGPALHMPEINFDGVAKHNRVDSSSDMVPPLEWFRISAVRYGTGGDLAVTYAGVDCTPTSLPAADTNGRRCRPQKWTPEGSAERQDWYHKYVVTQVTQVDRTAESNVPSAPVPVTTTVQYLGAPAWRFDELDATTSVADATWSQWRGYGRVRVVKGLIGQTQSVTESLFYRGMDGDRTASGPPKDVKITDSTGVTVDDTNEFSGQPREQLRYNGATVADKSISAYWLSEPTATMARPWGTLTAHRSGHKQIDQYQATDSGVLQTSTRHSYAADGRLLEKHMLNDVATGTDDTCTRYEYVANPAKGLLELPAREQTVSVGCNQPWTKDHVISDERVYYDDATSYTATPQRGVATRGERLAGFDGSGAPTYESVFTAEYDPIGRQTSLTDALQHTVRRHITPAYGPVTRVVEVAPNGHRTTTDYEPAWGERIAVTQPDGRRAEAVLDALGRTSRVWKPGHSPSTDPPDVEYEYLLPGDAAPVVTTKTRIDADSVDESHEVYDGLMRLRQTQEPTPAGGRLVTDHRYDSRGHQTEVNGPYYNDAPPAAELLLVDPATLPKQEVTTWDATDRPAAQVIMREGTELWRISHDVNATRQTTDPPPGQAPTTRISDARGRLVELRQYTGDQPTGAYDKTTYTYNPAGQLKTISDPAGNVWTYDYDVRGRQISEQDPDKGVTTFEYDAVDQVTFSTDARGVRLAYAYDANGRRTAVHRTSLTGPKLVEWTYDTLAEGRPTSTTRYVINGGTTSAYTSAITGYDPAGRPTGNSVTLPPSEGRLTGTYTVSQTYTDDDEVATRTLPAVGDLAAETLTYGYNEQGLPNTLSSELGSYVRDLSYTPFDEADTLTLGTGNGRWVQQLFEYELGTRRVNRVVTNREMLPRRVSDTTYGYDPAGNVTRITDTPSATAGVPTDTQCFSYDYLRRLTQAWTPASNDCQRAPAATSLGGPAPYWHKWTFDKTGNRQTEERISAAGAITSTYRYSGAKPHALQSVTTTGLGGTTSKSFEYDAAGNTRSRTQGGVTETLNWDEEGHLRDVTKPGQTTSFVYDGDGNRLLRKDPSGTTLYLGETELTLGTDGALTGTRYYSFDGQVIAVRAKSKLSWLLSDLHGTPTITIDAVSQTVQRRRTTPYGEVRGTPPSAWPGQRDFANGTSDPSTGLVHLGARDYDPATGRFISVDPLLDPENPQQLNGYSYANNNPTSYDDSDGKHPVAVVAVFSISIKIVAIVVVVLIALLIIEQFVVPHEREIKQTVWDFVSWAWRTTVRAVTEWITLIRTVIKYIEQRRIDFIVQITVTIKWIKKVIGQARKPVRNQAKPNPVKPKPKQPIPKKPTPKKPAPKKPDAGKGNKPGKGSRGPDGDSKRPLFGQHKMTPKNLDDVIAKGPRRALEITRDALDDSMRVTPDQYDAIVGDKLEDPTRFPDGNLRWRGMNTSPNGAGKELGDLSPTSRAGKLMLLGRLLADILKRAASG